MWPLSVDSKVANFNLLHLRLAPPLGLAPIEFCRDLRRQKTRVLRLSCGVVLRYPAFSRFSRTATCDRQRDTTTAYTLCMFYLFILFIVYVLCMTSCLHVIGANDCKPQGPRHTRNVILAKWFTIVRQVATPCCSNRGRSQLSPAVLSCL